MGRVYDELKVNGSKFLALFDSGATHSFMTQKALGKTNAHPQPLKHPYTTGLGGKNRKITHFCVLEGYLHRYPIDIQVYVVDTLGKTPKGELEVLFGALDMQKWSIEMDLKREKLDLSHYQKVWIEF